MGGGGDGMCWRQKEMHHMITVNPNSQVRCLLLLFFGEVQCFFILEFEPLLFT